MRIPIIDKTIVYLDHNVFVKAVKDRGFRRNLIELRESGRVLFPFNRIHIAEVNRIHKTNAEDIRLHLEVIKMISDSQYLDFRGEIENFTVRPRDPYEAYQSINEVSQSFIDSISKCAAGSLRPDLLDLPEDQFRLDAIFSFLTKKFRAAFPDISKSLNNLSRAEAVSHLRQYVFIDPSLEEFHEIVRSQLNQQQVGEMSFDYFLDTLLLICGYHSRASELKKPGGLLDDHQHFSYAASSPIIVSDDERLRRRLFAKFSNGEKAIMDSTASIAFLYVFTGL